MGNHDHGPVFNQIRQCPLHQYFRFRIQVRRGFIQNQNRSVLQQRTGDGDALPLAAAELCAPLADHCVVALRQPRDKLFRQCVPRGLAHFVHSGVLLAVTDVVRHGVVE